MEPLLPWTDRIAAALGLVWAWACAHPGTLGLAVLGLAAAFRFRREALDALATTAWAIGSRRDGRGCVLATLRLLERRSRWAGHPGPPARPSLAGMRPSRRPATGRPRAVSAGSIRLADWALYAPEGRSATSALG